MASVYVQERATLDGGSLAHKALMVTSYNVIVTVAWHCNEQCYTRNKNYRVIFKVSFYIVSKLHQTQS